MQRTTNTEANRDGHQYETPSQGVRQRKISKIIPFVRDAEGEYESIFEGIKFKLWHATVPHSQWGLTVRRISDEMELHHGHSIAWYGAQKRAVAAAEKILERELSDRAALAKAEGRS